MPQEKGRGGCIVQCGIKLHKDMVSAGDQLQPDSVGNPKAGIAPELVPWVKEAGLMHSRCQSLID